MTDCCVMVLQPHCIRVMIGPFQMIENAKRWIANNGAKYPRAQFKIARLDYVEAA